MSCLSARSLYAISLTLGGISQEIPPGYRLAMWCDPDLAIAIAIANQDHGLDGYTGEALILILILDIARRA